MNLLKHIWPWSQFQEQEETITSLVEVGQQTLKNFRQASELVQQYQQHVAEQQTLVDSLLQRNKEVIAMNRALSARLASKTPVGLQEKPIPQPRRVDVPSPWPGMAEHQRRQREAAEREAAEMLKVQPPSINDPMLGAEAAWPFPRSAP